MIKAGKNLKVGNTVYCGGASIKLCAPRIEKEDYVEFQFLVNGKLDNIGFQNNEEFLTSEE